MLRFKLAQEEDGTSSCVCGQGGGGGGSGARIILSNKTERESFSPTRTVLAMESEWWASVRVGWLAWGEDAGLRIAHKCRCVQEWGGAWFATNLRVAVQRI